MKYLSFKPLLVNSEASYDIIADFVLKYGCAGTDLHWLGVAST